MSHEKLMRAIELIGTPVAPALREQLGEMMGGMIEMSENLIRTLDQHSLMSCGK